MKKVIIPVLVFILSLPVYAKQFDGVKTFATESSLKPFARDIGGLVGSGIYTTARSLGFKGFDVSSRVAVQFKPSPGNIIMQQDGVDAFYIPWIQYEMGMFLRLDAFVRGFSHNGLTVSGGGLRWGITKINDAPYAFQLIVVGVAHAMVHESFSATHLGLGLAASWKIPRIMPYLGVGLDRTRLTVKEAPTASLLGKTVEVTEPRYTAGINMKLARLLYSTIAFNLLHKEPAFEASLGVRF
jgi:hypothetical protein